MKKITLRVIRGAGYGAIAWGLYGLLGLAVGSGDPLNLFRIPLKEPSKSEVAKLKGKLFKSNQPKP